MNSLLGYIKKRKDITIIFLIIAVSTAYLSSKLSIYLGNFFDLAGGSISIGIDELFRFTLMSLFGYVVLNLVLDVVKGKFINIISIFLKENFIERLFKKSIVEFNKKDKIEYKSLIISDINQIIDLFITYRFEIINNMAKIIVSIIVLLRINVLGTLLVLMLSTFPIIVSILLSSKIGVYVQKFIGGKQEFIKRNSELLTGFDTFTIYGSKTNAINEFEKTNRKEAEIKRKSFIFIEGLSGIIGITSISITILTMIVGMFLALKGWITIGQVFTLSFISNGVSTPLMDLSSIIPEYLGGKKIVDKYEGLLEINEIKREKPINFEKGISSKDLGLSRDKKILENINIELEKDNKYLFVGGSGSGKSTLVKLLIGQLDDYEGDIYWNNINLDEISEESIYENVTYLPQEAFLLNDTIRNNLTLFNSDISDEKIYEALEFVNLKEMFKGSTEGLDYVINEEKSNLSGGEKQRLALARGLLYLNKVLIMDEATSALDNENFRDIENKIANIGNLTVINVCHRINEEFKSKYSKVINFEKGKIV
ncbi:ABC transporter ATP-binding protein/permease [Clostridium algidicarnis]|uniref:ATP-binding cassette domain-containing protein n=1 Tax=Clostridium algidicarnis TaxID=37659 RepID=UPI001C0BDABC|nr:ABC transporter ATP-binding protein [Clostridium algidicarnis]MBU3210557.1 ABC transporter ATP-binding protein/permease [Clostridium algidicarnis]